MHVDVDLARIERHEQRHDRMAIARQIVGISRAHRAEQKLVAHGPVIDEKILAERVGARVGRQGSIAFDQQALAPGADFHRINAKLRAQDVAEPREPAGPAGQSCRPGHRRALLARERESDIGPAHRQTPHDFAHGFPLAAVALQEFQPRRCGVEQVAHLDACSLA